MIAIYYQGYLIPKTPYFTKKYFPRWLIRIFHGEIGNSNLFSLSKVEKSRHMDRNPYSFLREHGLITPCQEADDICLSENFYDAWKNQIEDTQENLESKLASIFDVDKCEIITTRSNQNISIIVGDNTVGWWDSEELLRVDLSTISTLKSFQPNEWSNLTRSAKNQIIGSLRIFLEQCPKCGMSIYEGVQEKETCCQIITEVTGRCRQCDVTYYNIEQIN